jgi:hypothetical protein
MGQVRQNILHLEKGVSKPWAKPVTYCELQRQRCKKLHLENNSIFFYICKNALAFYKSGVVVVNSIVVGLASGLRNLRGIK